MGTFPAMCLSHPKLPSMAWRGEGAGLQSAPPPDVRPKPPALPPQWGLLFPSNGSAGAIPKDAIHACQGSCGAFMGFLGWVPHTPPAEPTWLLECCSCLPGMIKLTFNWGQHLLFAPSQALLLSIKTITNPRSDVSNFMVLKRVKRICSLMRGAVKSLTGSWMDQAF